MKSINRFIIVLILVTSILLPKAQIVIHDHRQDKNPRYITIVRGNLSAPSKGKEYVPDSLSHYSNAPFADQISFPGNGDAMLKKNPGQILFSRNLKFGSGSIRSAKMDTEPTSLIFYTDTLVIHGRFTIDLSRNRPCKNGFLFVACRILQIQTGSELIVCLSDTQMKKDRKALFFIEQVFVDGHKIFKEADALESTITCIDKNLYTTYYRGVLRTGDGLSTTGQYRHTNFSGIVTDSIKFNPLVVRVGFLPIMNETNKDLFKFFSKWVVASYKDILGKIARDAAGFDKMAAVKDYISFVSLNRYEDLEQLDQAISRLLIKEINDYKSKIFTNDFDFERRIYLDGADTRLVGSVTDHGIEYFLPPSKALVNPFTVDGKTVLGYLLFDELKPNFSTIEFEITLAPDTRSVCKIKGALNTGEQLNNGVGEFRFSNLNISSPDLIPAMTKVVSAGSNRFRISLGISNGSPMLFSKLFSATGSDITLSGKWSNENGGISGDFKAPVTFSKITGQAIGLINAAIVNNSIFPVKVDFFTSDDKLNEQSPPFIISPGKSAQSSFKNETGTISMVDDGLSFILSPEKFGDYLEQIDGSDKTTQELTIENHISANPLDSLSGYLRYTEVVITYARGQTKCQQTIRLTSAGSFGDKATMIIPKSSKEAIPVTISGKVIYENGESAIRTITLTEGETRFDLFGQALLKDEKSTLYQ